MMRCVCLYKYAHCVLHASSFIFQPSFLMNRVSRILNGGNISVEGVEGWK